MSTENWFYDTISFIGVGRDNAFVFFGDFFANHSQMAEINIFFFFFQGMHRVSFTAELVGLLKWKYHSDVLFHERVSY